MGQGVGIGGLPTPLVVVCAGDVCQYSAFAPGSSEGARSFVSLSTVHPNYPCTQLSLVSLCFAAGGHVCAGASTTAKGPRSHLHPGRNIEGPGFLLASALHGFESRGL